MKINFNLIQPPRNNPHQFKGNDKADNPRIDTFERKGNIWQLVYNEDGSLQKSLKNGEVFKEYSYPECLPEFYHVFPDKSKLEEIEYFGFQTPKVTDVYDGKKLSVITRYGNPRHTNEPAVDIETLDEEGNIVTKRLLQAGGEEIKDFESLESAKQYFLSEYGITIYLDNLAQAHILKSAIDDFIKLTGDKKMFDGLLCVSGNKDTTDDYYEEISKINIKDCDDTDFINSDENETFIIDYGDEEETLETTAVYSLDKESSLSAGKVIEPTIILNSKYDWTNAENLRTEEKDGLLSTGTLKGLIQHELMHYLHSKCDLNLFCQDTFPDLKDEQEIMKEVSEYASSEPCEFVAEYGAGRIAGKNYSAEVDNLYKKYNGPKLFSSVNE